MKRQQPLLRKMVGSAVALLALCYNNVYSISAPITPQQLPSTALPSSVSRSLKAQQRTAGPQALAPLAAPQPPPNPMEEQAKKITFKLTKITLKGNHIYTDQQLLPIYQDKLNKTISVADLFQIVRDISNYYRNNGYILSRALLPPQHVKNGAVTIQIIEGFVDKVNVVGDPGRADVILQKFGTHIQESRPLQVKVMENTLLLANQIPGVTTRAVLTPSKQTTGASDVDLVTQLKRWTGYISYDDYGTRYIGPQQITGNIGYNSSFLSGDSTLFTYVKTPKGKELAYGDFSYNLPLGSRGVRWILGGNRAITNPLFTLAPLKIAGEIDDYYTIWQFPIILTRSANLSFQAALNYLDSTVTSFNKQLYTDHLRTVKLNGIYNFADSFRGNNLINLGFGQGLQVLGATASTTSTTTSRFGGRGNFTKFELTLSRVQGLFGHFSLFGLLHGQYAFNPLLASEQFSYGGPLVGRGYDPAEIIGDRGLAGSLELRYDLTLAPKFLPDMQLYIFYDGGEIWNLKRVAGVKQKQSATSTGIGARMYFNAHLSGNLMFTQPLTKQVAAEALIGRGRLPRTFFSIVASL